MATEVEEKSRRRKRRGAVEEEIVEEVVDKSITAPKGRATRGNRSVVSKEEVETGNFITRTVRGTVAYFRGVQDELDKVVWPTREDLIRLTRVVLVVTILCAIGLGIISFIFTELFIIGLRDDQPLIFVVFFAVVGLGFFAYTRFFSGQNNPPPY